MILSSMNLTDRINEVSEAHRLLRNVCRSGRIAGGYPRDAYLGRDASDIDFWVPIRRYPDAARRVQLVMDLGEALGQRQFRKVGDTSGRTIHEALHSAQVSGSTSPLGNPLGPNQGNYTTGGPSGYVEAWEAHGEFFQNTGNFNPLQVIFTSHPTADDIHFRFHVGLTQFIVDPNGTIHPSFAAMRDYREGILTLTEPLQNTPALLGRYLQKIKRKYPENRVNMNMSLQEPRWGEYYQALINAGVLDAPREMVQTQTEIFNWDTVRLDNRASFVNNVGINEWAETPVPPVVPPVHDDEEVRARFPNPTPLINNLLQPLREGSEIQRVGAARIPQDMATVRRG